MAVRGLGPLEVPRWGSRIGAAALMGEPMEEAGDSGGEAQASRKARPMSQPCDLGPVPWL